MVYVLTGCCTLLLGMHTPTGCLVLESEREEGNFCACYDLGCVQTVLFLMPKSREVIAEYHRGVAVGSNSHVVFFFFFLRKCYLYL